MRETWVWSLGRKDPLEKEMATHSSILTWRIPWTEEPGRATVHSVTKESDTTEVTEHASFSIPSRSGKMCILTTKNSFEKLDSKWFKLVKNGDDRLNYSKRKSKSINEDFCSQMNNTRIFQNTLIEYFAQVIKKKMIAQNSFWKEMAGPTREAFAFGMKLKTLRNV